jgi:hypothetical protein
MKQNKSKLDCLRFFYSLKILLSYRRLVWEYTENKSTCNCPDFGKYRQCSHELFYLVAKEKVSVPDKYLAADEIAGTQKVTKKKKFTSALDKN